MSIISENVKEQILGSWITPIREWGLEPVMERTLRAVIGQFRTKTVFPPKSKIFRAFVACPYDKVSVVFIGQDPYHDGSATGLCFANEGKDKLSPSLDVMKREWETNITRGEEFDPTLIKWADQGVLLLNTALTVEQGEPKSHMELWKHWTANFLEKLSEANPDLCYVMFGRKAQEWQSHIVHGHVLKVVHPAAEVYSNGNAKFFGCRFFDVVNDQLALLNKETIEW
jgi:uracil-DNA glycosylase